MTLKELSCRYRSQNAKEKERQGTQRVCNRGYGIHLKTPYPKLYTLDLALSCQRDNLRAHRPSSFFAEPFAPSINPKTSTYNPKAGILTPSIGPRHHKTHAPNSHSIISTKVGSQLAHGKQASRVRFRNAEPVLKVKGFVCVVIYMRLECFNCYAMKTRPRTITNSCKDPFHPNLPPLICLFLMCLLLIHFPCTILSPTQFHLC